ncbi:MAG TPA: class I SAM-dependent methyltransferase [Vicinamibacterales bacterium]|jgi:ubiquinone/menaquinone biosynthesis C-methylase UbiE
MGLRSRLFASIYDRFTAGAEEACFRAHRAELLTGARGKVLEIGAGTGANLPFYSDAADAVTCVEPEAAMIRRLALKARQQQRPIEIVEAPAERLPLPDAHFDTVVSTLVLCTVADQRQALAEVRRVLKPGGTLLFMEHVRSEDPKLAKWQDRLNGVNRFVACGCNCNRSTVDAIRAAGFAITALTKDTIQKAPPFVRPLVVGAARSQASGVAPGTRT